MRNDTYWANRMRILEEALLDTGYDYVKNLERQYDAAIRDIESQIAVWYQRFAKNNDISLAEARRLLTTQELKEFKWTVEEYIKAGQQNAVSQAWMKQLENASARVHISRLDSLKIQLQQQAELLHGSQSEALNSTLAELYERGYYRTAFEIQKGLGVGWSLHGLTDEAIKKVLSKPWTLDGQTFSNRIWTNKQALVNTVNTQLTQMIMRGAAPDKSIKAIAERFSVSKSQAGRLVMTESAAFANMARKDCFADLGVERFVVVETLDNETCSLCGQLDGKVFPMSEYAVGVTAPPFHPWCRGTTAPYFEDLEGLGDRYARDAEGKRYEVPRDMTYEDWKSKAVKEWRKDFNNSTKNANSAFTNEPEDAIIKMEKTPEEQLEKIIKGKKLTAPYKEKVREAFSKGTDRAKKAFVKYVKPSSLADAASTTGAYFSPREKKVYFNAVDALSDPRGPTVVYFHEFGHLIDFKAASGWNAYKSSLKKSARFSKALHADFDKLVKSFVSQGLTEQQAHARLSAIANDALHNQISDLFGGLSQNAARGRYGHDTSYWASKGSLEQEAWAHMFESQFDTDRYALMQKYFPTALQEFESMLEEVAK